MTESAAASLFYVGLALFVFGLVRFVRSSVERGRRDTTALAFVAVGLVFLGVAVAVFVRSPKDVLPF